MFNLSPIIAYNRLFLFGFLCQIFSLFDFNLWLLSYELTLFILMYLAVRLSVSTKHLELHQSLLYVYYGSFIRAYPVLRYWAIGPFLLIFTSGSRIIIFQWQLSEDDYHELIWQLRQMTF